MNRCLCRNMFNSGGCKIFINIYIQEDIKEQDILIVFITMNVL